MEIQDGRLRTPFLPGGMERQDIRRKLRQVPILHRGRYWKAHVEVRHAGRDRLRPRDIEGRGILRVQGPEHLRAGRTRRFAQVEVQGHGPDSLGGVYS